MRISNHVDSRIVYGIISLLIISTGTSFAQESIISVITDDRIYAEGDTIVISGVVKTKVGDTPVTLQLFSQGNLVDIAQISVAQDGTYSHTVIAEGPLWRNSGEYTVRVSYGEGNIAETDFNYSPKSESFTTTDNFEVDAGSQGTFDVEYSIKGGTVTDMIVDSDIFALIVQIDATDKGTITLDLPREFIGAEKQDGKDDAFIILIDGIEVPYQESVVHADSRIITINFEQEDSDIEVIGTYVVPEFGTIVLVVLSIGIFSTILISRNRLQINYWFKQRSIFLWMEKLHVVLQLLFWEHQLFDQSLFEY